MFNTRSIIDRFIEYKTFVSFDGPEPEDGKVEGRLEY